MATVQEVFNRIKETKRKAKEVKQMYKDELETSSEYRDVLEKLEILKARKKEIEQQIKNTQEAEFRKLDAYKMHVKNDTELLSDLVINDLIKGQSVSVTDEQEQAYEPVFSVRFKKAALVATNTES